VGRSTKIKVTVTIGFKLVLSIISIPQKQCDVDHCLHRAFLICNSIYLCYPMSHTANQCNSIIRRGCGEWCYGIGDQKYV